MIDTKGGGHQASLDSRTSYFLGLDHFSGKHKSRALFQAKPLKPGNRQTALAAHGIFVASK